MKTVYLDTETTGLDSGNGHYLTGYVSSRHEDQKC